MIIDILCALVLLFIGPQLLFYTLSKIIDCIFKYWPKKKIIPIEWSADRILDFMNRDLSRVLATLHEQKDSGATGVVCGPRVLLTQDRQAFAYNYMEVISSIRAQYSGPRVKEINIKRDGNYASHELIFASQINT